MKNYTGLYLKIVEKKWGHYTSCPFSNFGIRNRPNYAVYGLYVLSRYNKLNRFLPEECGKGGHSLYWLSIGI